MSDDEKNKNTPSEEAPEIAGTSKLKDRQDLPDALFGPFRMGGQPQINFAVLPEGVPPWKNRDTRWRILLEGLLPTVPSLAIEIAGDVVIGRGKGDPETLPDLNLEKYKAIDKGVSRRHAMLRPTKNHLFLMDLGSTNGTMHNAIPLGPGIARSVGNNDVISLGNLNFTVKIVKRPQPMTDKLSDQGRRKP